MNEADLPIAELPWTTWWMLISFAVFAIGGFGWWLVKTLVGASAIVGRKEGDPKFSSLREQLLPGRSANQPFKRMVAGRGLNTRIGRLCFTLMLVGLVAHFAFWIYAAVFLKQ